MRQRWVLGGLLSLALLGVCRLAVGEGTAATPARPAVEGNRAPSAITFSPDGSLVYVTETAEDDVAVVDAAMLTVRARYASGGSRPTGICRTPDGSELLVANSYSGSVSILNARTGKIRATVSLPGMPQGVAVSPDGKRAFVSVSQLDEVAVLDLATAAVVRRVRVGRRPGALDVSQDGFTLVVANLSDGSLSVIDTGTLAEDARVKLKGTNVRGVRVTADGREAYATAMPAFNTKPSDDPAEIWHNVIQSVRLEGEGSAPGEDQWTDFARIPGESVAFGSPDQYDLVLDRTARRAWVSVAGRDVVTRISIHDPRRNTIWPFSQVETGVGANPRGLALSPDESRLWVANHLGNTVSVIDTASGMVVKTLDLGKASRVDPTVAGQYLFNNAGLTRLHRFTCASCHPDGSTDGLTWSFVHVRDGVARRNSRDLRAEIAKTPPYRWSGVEATLPEFLVSEVTGLLGGPKPTAEQSQALVDAISAFRLPPNPYRAADGGLTAEARRGQALFAGKANCVSCHAGPQAGGTGVRAWVGTTAPGQKLDVPHLEGVYDSAPYLHDGRAATLEEVFMRFNEQQRHGAAHLLTEVERADLMRYLREL